MHQFSKDLKEQSLQGRKILLAEDENRLRTVVQMMLEDLGATVITVADGASAIDQYRRQPQDIDIVLLDVRMAGLGGQSTYEKLLDIDPQVKVILSSGVLPGDDLVSLIKENAGGFIGKPFNLAELSTAIVKVLAGESVIWTAESA